MALRPKRSAARKKRAPQYLSVQLLPLTGIPEICEGDDLARLIVQAARKQRAELRQHDILVVAQKILSKAEGRVVRLSSVQPSARALQLAAARSKDPRLVEVILQESRRIVRDDPVLIVETHHGFVCANAGVDASNMEPGQITLLPVDPDKSARRLRARIRQLTGRSPALIISDTFGRAWRVGQVNVAIGVAGMIPVMDYRGSVDHFGIPLKVTTIAIADELASAAELVMGKADGVPAAVARGVRFRRGRGNARSLVRQPQDDLFR